MTLGLFLWLHFPIVVFYAGENNVFVLNGTQDYFLTNKNTTWNYARERGYMKT